MKNLKITSGFEFQGFTITDYLGFCSGECALGTGFLSSLNAGLADIFGDVSSKYSEKLENAKDYALEALSDNALKLDANAIIGVHVCYTTFSSDIMGVIATGTAVKISKDGCLNSLDSKKELPVLNYYPDLNFRISKLEISASDSPGVCFLKAFVVGKNISALKTTISFSTIFDDTYNLPNISFTDFAKPDKASNKWESKVTTLELQSSIVPLLKSVTVTIEKYIADDVIHSVDSESCSFSGSDTSMSDSDGTPNNEMKYLSAINFLESAKEISDYTNGLGEIYFINDELLKIIERCVNTEKIYGNAKDYCITRIQEYLK